MITNNVGQIVMLNPSIEKLKKKAEDEYHIPLRFLSPYCLGSTGFCKLQATVALIASSYFDVLWTFHLTSIDNSSSSPLL
jgi:hypothetical protein